MASSAIHDALVTYLTGDSGDIRTTVNGEQSNLLPSGSVYLDTGQYTRNTYSAQVIVRPVKEISQQANGIGSEEITHSFDLVCIVNRKASSDGSTLTDKAEDVARALVRRYQRVSNLSLAPSGGTFVRASARRSDLARTNESGDTSVSVVRASFTFSEALAANT